MMRSLSVLDAAAVLIVLAAVLSWFNQRFLKLPPTIGLTLMGAVASLIVVSVERLAPGRGASDLLGFVEGIDFRTTLMDGMLSFLLFAGALHVDWRAMRRGRWPILVLSTIGTIASTMIVGGGFWLITAVLGLSVPVVWCLVFGALISPTDPVSVIQVLKRLPGVSSTLEATVAGESLFNDGIGVVIFTIILGSAMNGQPFSWTEAGRLFVIEAGGGVVMGLVIGWIGFRIMRSIDEYAVEVMISLAVVMGGYALAGHLQVSGPVAMAVAGVLIGNHGVAHAMSDTTRDYLLKFWSLIDEILNAVLFLLIGLQVVMIPADPRLWLLGVAAIPLVLGARAVSVLAPLTAMRPLLNLGPLATTTLVWGGLRGGISVALALGLPTGEPRSAALAATYLVVLFSVIIQGGTIQALLRWRQRKSDEMIGNFGSQPQS